ncbi:MAG TPA: 50S ribosomal protein L30 [Thermoanaerobaculia bacterium]|nr:50S ribosomal protein L30 [Thermoanaerobaculia bacterium]
MSDTDKTEKIEIEKTEKRKKTPSKVNAPAQAGAATPKSAADAGATATPSSPSKQPPAAAEAAAPKSSGAASAAVQNPSAAAKAAAPKQIRIRQVRSGICAPVDQKLTLSGLGLRRIRQEVVRPDTPTVRGQVQKVRHLVEIVEGGAAR